MTKLLSLFTNKIFLGVFCGILVALISIITWKYYDLKSTISDLETQVTDYKNKYLVCQVDLTTEQYNGEVLKNSITSLNSSIEQLELKNKELQKTYDAYKKQTTEEKFKNAKVIDIMKSKAETCEEGKRINNILSGLKYDEIE